LALCPPFGSSYASPDRRRWLVLTKGLMMIRRTALWAVVALALVSVGAVACSSTNTATTTTSVAGGGAALGTTTVKSATTQEPTGTAIGGSGGSVPAGAITVDLGDTSGLNGPMTMTVTPNTTKAGDVTFVVKNTGTIEHEMIVLKLDSGQTWDKVPVVDSGDPPSSVATGADKVDEANSVGETGDPNLQPGDTRTFTVSNMAAGQYALVCNIAQHYGMGMRASFTVT
jgi:uncharacterized cupredoxin-like copper-binding protein